MNKKLLTLAVGAALAATSGIAAAEVNWYGKMNVNVQKTSSDASPAADALDVAAGGSKLGFRAAEDTDNGLEAFVWMQLVLDNADGSAGNLGFDDALVGLRGDFGTVAAGKTGTAYKGFTGGFDLFGDSVGDFNGSQGGATFSGIIKPAGTGIGYSNSVGDLSFAVGHSTENGTKNNNTDTSGHLKYSMDNFSVGIAAINWSDGSGAGAPTAKSATAVGGTYTMDNLGFRVLYEQVSDLGAVASADSKTMGLGATFGTGAGTVKFQYYKTDYSAAAGTGDTKSFAIGYGMNLSDNVSAGVNYAKIDSDTATMDSTGWDVGMTVQF